MLRVLGRVTNRMVLHSPKTVLRFGILLTAFLACVPSQATPDNSAPVIDQLMTKLYQRGQFNGAILVAKQGKVLYRGAFGKANIQTGVDFTLETPSDIGSLTKQFTAMAIMILAQQKKLSYDDPVAKYIPELSRSSQLSQITLRQLLTHTSGIPDYGDLGIDDAGLDQNGLITALLRKQNLLGKPGLEYRYSNPGYVLLAIVVERVSGKTFGSFLDQEIFKPVGMSNTFVYGSSAQKTARAAIGYNQFGGVDDSWPTAIPGDGGIYSTVNDLFKWDQALYTDQLVPHYVLSEAFTPGKVQCGTTTYGFGWNIVEENGDRYVWHQGSRAGFRAFIERRLTDRVTVIILTNRGNSKRQDMNAAIQNILAGKSYSLPKQSGAEKLYKVIHDSGIQCALQTYYALKNAKDADYDLGEDGLNALGYQLLYGDKHAAAAIAIFELNTREHPSSSNAFDSLGEAYWRDGNNNLAIASYESALHLDPSNGHAAAMLRQLRLRHWVLLSGCIVGTIGVSALLVNLALRKHSATPL